MEAAQISGVPFFTVDYWDRSKFLRPSVSLGRGRGKGRERFYSYGDILRLRIARELRDEQVSLETLRKVVDKLERHTGRLPTCSYALIGRSVRLVRTPGELSELLERSRGRRIFAILLDLTRLSSIVQDRAQRMLETRARRKTPAPGASRRRRVSRSRR